MQHAVTTPAGRRVTDRLVEIVVPDAGAERVMALLADYPLLGRWRDTESGHLLLKVLLPAQEAEPVLDRIQHEMGGDPGLRVVLLPVAATIPRPSPELEDVPPDGKPDGTKRFYRISRDELYAQAEQSIRTTPIFAAMTALSAVVAAVGLMADNLAVLIGAMMIAPLLAPNVALAMGTALGDVRLIRDSLKANLAGVSIALGLAVAAGFVFGIDPDIPAVASRTQLQTTDLILALAAGAAGTLAFTSGLPSAVIGVMVAVALLPPLVNFGLLLGGGQLGPAFGAALLLVANVICVNLAGVVTLLAQGIRPRTWWEAERARRSTRTAMILWAGLLAVLALTLVLSRPGQ